MQSGQVNLLLYSRERDKRGFNKRYFCFQLVLLETLSLTFCKPIYSHNVNEKSLYQCINFIGSKSPASKIKYCSSLSKIVLNAITNTVQMHLISTLRNGTKWKSFQFEHSVRLFTYALSSIMCSEEPGLPY